MGVEKRRKAPARWRKARFPEAGTRWDTPMNRAVWHRDHSEDLELWCGGKHAKRAAKEAVCG